MAFKTFLIAFTSDELSDEDMPSEEDVVEAFTEYLGIPNENATLNVITVNVESQGFEEGICRRCGQQCEDTRLFCNDCAGDIIEGTAEEEVEET